ncbi:DUF2637 domain-containing protein [Streptomyces sp. NPDC059651]|uniref:DUF2637 domain-containing protein n=1 Tax=Streptomyces sp. NPDC059651 TaxID=3346897 RepID=UPI00367B68E7
MTTTVDLDKAVPVGHGRRHVVWTRGRRVTFTVIGFGSLLIALTGFVGSYTAVRDLAEEKGFGWFVTIFPLGIDVGIIVMCSTQWGRVSGRTGLDHACDDSAAVHRDQ